MWAKVRNLELQKPKYDKKIVIDESIDTNNTKDIFDLNPTNNIIQWIKKLDTGSGVSIEMLSSKNIENMDKLIDILLKEGDIFEVKPGRLKVLE